MIDQDEVLKVSRAMIREGGSFVCELGRALSHADPTNQQKIKDAFPEYWERYTRIAERLAKKGDY